MKRNLRLATAFFTVALLLMTLAALLIPTQPSVPLATASRPEAPQWKALSNTGTYMATSTPGNWATNIPGPTQRSQPESARHTWSPDNKVWDTRIEFSGQVPSGLLEDSAGYLGGGHDAHTLYASLNPGDYVLRANGQVYKFSLWAPGEFKYPGTPQSFVRCSQAVAINTENRGSEPITLEVSMGGVLSAEKISGQSLVTIWKPVGNITTTLTGQKPVFVEAASLPDNCK